MYPCRSCGDADARRSFKSATLSVIFSRPEQLTKGGRASRDLRDLVHTIFPRPRLNCLPSTGLDGWSKLSTLRPVEAYGSKCVRLVHIPRLLSRLPGTVPTFVQIFSTGQCFLFIEYM
ncbi:unnamed protein product [Ectocarpus sp. 13 AM-2016]